MELSKVKSYDNGVSSNLDGEAYKIEADAEFFNHLSKRIYTDSILAIVRELMCNAWDSQVEAGNADTPITVHCPNILEPVFKVIDTGLGMDLDTLKNVYSSYGKSTKRSNMDVTGGLGVGSKTPFAYTDSFTVYSVKDGMKHTMVNYKDKGMPKIKEIFSVPTDEPNGVEIHVPVKTDHFDDFRTRIQAMATIFHGNVNVLGIKNYSYETVNVYQNDDLRTFFTVDNEIVDPDLFQVEESRVSSFTSSQMLVLMGNVPYQVDLNKLNLESTLRTMIDKDLTDWRRVTCLEMPVGSLDFSMSREHLEYSDRTIEVLTQKLQDIYDQAYKLGKRAIDKCTNRYEQYQLEKRLHDEAPSIFKDPKYVWKELITLNVNRRGLESLRFAGYSSDVVTKKLDRANISGKVCEYKILVPDSGQFDVHVIVYQNRNLKRKRIEKLYQNTPTMSVSTSRRHADNNQTIVMQGTKADGQRVVDIITKRVEEFEGNVRVHLHDLSEVEVEREVQEKASKGMGKRINPHGSSYTVTIGHVQTGLDNGSSYYVYINTEDREIDYSDTECHKDVIDLLPRMLDDTTFNQTWTDPENAKVLPVRYYFLMLNKTTRKLAHDFENMIHVDEFMEQFGNEIKNTIAEFVEKKRTQVMYKFASNRTRTREELSNGVRYSWDWDQFVEKMEDYHKFSVKAFGLPLTSYSDINKTLRRYRLEDRRAMRKEVEELKTTQYGRLQLTKEITSRQLEMYRTYSKKRQEKYRYSKRK